MLLLCFPFLYPIPSAAAANPTITVNTDHLTVRSTPSLDGDLVASINMGEQYPYVKKEGEWIQITLPNGKKGWVADYLVLVNEKGEKSGQGQANQQNNRSTMSSKQIYITQNGTNIRKNPNTLSTILTRANKGDTFEVVGFENDWYEIKLSKGQTGYVAKWVVSDKAEAKSVHVQTSTSSIENIHQEGLGQYLEGKKIVIDPGHGGKDDGASGASGTLEKQITMETASRLYHKLKDAGADVILTRYKDQYLSLPARVSITNRFDADAFISIHYDSFDRKRAEGATTFFYHPWQKELAVDIHSSLMKKISISDRGVRKGDYYVIRENSQEAVLIELGFLSNPAEELLITSNEYQISAATGIYEGLARYFKSQ